MHRIEHLLVRRKTVLIRVMAVILAVFGSTAMLSQSAFAQNYKITDGERVTYHTSFATDPVEVLDEAGFELGKDDTYTTQQSDGVSEIYVQRTQTVTINNGGQILSTGSQGETVEQLLNRMNITIDPQTTVSQPLDAQTTDGMEIVVNRTTYVTETYTQTIPHEVKQLNDAERPLGEQQVLTAGSDGEMRCTAQVTYINGVETARTVISSEVTLAPVDELVAVGTAAQEAQLGELVIGDGVITLESGDVLTYDSTKQVVATGYTHTDAGCDTITATGTTVRVGTVAVDPSVIPYGTRMFIVTNDGSYIYGVATAEDCGGAIKGNKVDLYFPTTDECYAFGRRNCTIYFLG